MSTPGLIRAAMAVKRSRREYCGGQAPYGWKVTDDGAHIEPDAAEQAIIRQAAELRAAGMSLRAIGAVLEAKGYAPRGGKRWNSNTVRRITGGARWHAETVKALVNAEVTE